MSQDVSELTLASEQAARRPRLDFIPPLAIAVTLAALIVRIAFLGNQSYWGDELFSVNQAAGNLRHVFAAGVDEIHTPLYATLLWAWETLGGTSTLWTHSLSGLFGLAAVVATYVCLRATCLSIAARWIAVALTAANGFGIVYSQEDRPYSLVLLGATGLTAVTVAQVSTRPDRTARAGMTWLGWALLTATAHLLGVVLVAATAVLLTIRALAERRHRLAVAQLGLAGLAMLPQLAWIVAGLGRTGFAAGTSWIKPADQHDVWTLLTTVFSTGGLVPLADGFAWTSAIGPVVAAGLLLLALVFWRGRRLDAWDSDARAGLALFILAAGVLLVTLAVSHWVHIWTLRNMIVVTPALTWGLAWIIIGLPRQEPVRMVMGAIILIALLMSLPGMAASLGQPYKTDWRSLVLYLEHERAVQPQGTFSLFGGPRGALLAADRGRAPASLRHVYDHVDIHPWSASAIQGLRRLPGPQIVVYYVSVAHAHPVDIERRIKGRLGDPSCHSVPIYGLAVIECAASS